METKKGLMVVLSGPSGCGKGTVLKELLSKEDNIFLSVSATTRLPRPGEEHGVHYFFLETEKFQEEIASGGMLEHACYCGNYYGTPRKPVFERCERGEDVILEIEVQGAMQVMESCPEAVSVFIMPPSLAELERRLVDRNTEDYETIQRRLKTAREEMQFACRYDYLVINENVAQAAEEIATIIRAEKNRTTRMAEFLKTMVHC